MEDLQEVVAECDVEEICEFYEYFIESKYDNEEVFVSLV